MRGRTCDSAHMTVRCADAVASWFRDSDDTADVYRESLARPGAPQSPPVSRPLGGDFDRERARERTGRARTRLREDALTRSYLMHINCAWLCSDAPPRLQ